MFRSSYWAILPLLIVGGILLWGVFISEEPAKKETKVFQPQIAATTPTLQAVPTQVIQEATKEATISAKTEVKYKIIVLNGSGKKGEAAKAEGILEGAGVSVAEIGNAGRSDYLHTVIQVKKEVAGEFITKIEDLLKPEYTLSSQVEVVKDVDNDITVVIGKTKALPPKQP